MDSKKEVTPPRREINRLGDKIQHSEGTFKIISPSVKLVLLFKLDPDHCAVEYAVEFEGLRVLSNNNLTITGFSNCQLLEMHDFAIKDPWNPLGWGFRTVLNEYSSLRLSFAARTTSDANSNLSVEFRAYDHGFGHAHTVSNNVPGSSRSELRFDFSDFPEDAISVIDKGHEFGFSTNKLSEKVYHENYWKKTEQKLPFLIKSPENVIVFSEACNFGFKDMEIFQLYGKGPLKNGIYAYYESDANPESIVRFPWFIYHVGIDEKDIVNSNIHPGNYCPPPEGDFSWVESGSVLRDVALATESALLTSSFMKNNSFGKYVLFDAKWYGDEYDPKSDPTTFLPMPLKKPLDLPLVVKELRENGHGLFLYVNDIALRQNAGAIFEQFVEWGVAGAKLGFVDVSTNRGMQRIITYVKMCAENNLMVNIHDDFRDFGISRTFPNVISSEGVRGDEHADVTPEHTLTLPFVRALAGHMDFTFALDWKRLAKGQKQPMFQYALPIVLWNGLNHILWYQDIWNIKRRGLDGAMQIWVSLPDSWEKSIILHGKVSSYISIARQAPDGTWFIATVSSIHKDFDLGFDFLNDGADYVATIYTDLELVDYDLNTLPVGALPSIDEKTMTLNQSSRVQFSLRRGSGHVIIARRKSH